MNTTTSEKKIKELFIGKCWEYLDDNFHKFSETNKIKIALELCKKDLPQEITGEGLRTQVNVFPTKTIIFRDLDDNANAGDSRSLHEPEGAESSRPEVQI